MMLYVIHVQQVSHVLPSPLVIAQLVSTVSMVTQTAMIVMPDMLAHSLTKLQSNANRVNIQAHCKLRQNVLIVLQDIIAQTLRMYFSVLHTIFTVRDEVSPSLGGLPPIFFFIPVQKYSVIFPSFCTIFSFFE